MLIKCYKKQIYLSINSLLSTVDLIDKHDKKIIEQFMSEFHKLLYANYKKMTFTSYFNQLDMYNKPYLKYVNFNYDTRTMKIMLRANASFNVQNQYFMLGNFLAACLGSDCNKIIVAKDFRGIF